MNSKSQVVVKKFGGTSVGSIERIEAVAARVIEDIKAGQKPVVVASAMSGETNRLVALANQLDPYYRGPAYDMLVASGEQVAIALLAIAFEKRGFKAEPLLAHQVGIQTDELFSKARIQNINIKRLEDLIAKKVIPIVAGFQGVTTEDRITTLGRGGSDTTAVAIAAAMGADECEIYTDVPAVFSADPRVVKRAREIPIITFEEMMEMASVGSKVLHFRSVEIAAKYGVRIHLRSTFEAREGTWIVGENQMLENPVVTSVTHDPQTVVIAMKQVPIGSAFLAGLFEHLAEKGIVIDIITQSKNKNDQQLAFSLPEEDLPQAEIILKNYLTGKEQVEVIKDMAKLSVVGVGMKNHPGVASRFFKALNASSVEIHLVTTSDIKISAVVARKDLAKAAEALHTEYGLDNTTNG
jgi:aspartate kinase